MPPQQEEAQIYPVISVKVKRILVMQLSLQHIRLTVFCPVYLTSHALCGLSWKKRILETRGKVLSTYTTLTFKVDGLSLEAQWLRIRLPMQGTWVQSLVPEDPTYRGATKPVCHEY